jgi:thioredoxin 1
MMSKNVLLLALLALATMIHSSQAFSNHQAAFVRHTTTSRAAASSSSSSLHAVKDINSEPAFDGAVKNAGSKLVVVDYSTTWCGPCKVIAPKFEELSEKYSDAVFLKVIGDASPEASKLMKREGVRSVPSFHYFMNGSKVDVVNGANAEAIEAAITKHLMTA